MKNKRTELLNAAGERLIDIHKMLHILGRMFINAEAHKMGVIPNEQYKKMLKRVLNLYADLDREKEDKHE